MTKPEDALKELFYSEIQTLSCYADLHIGRWKGRIERCQTLLDEAEQKNQHERALMLGCWIDALKEAEEYAGYMRRDILSAKGRIEALMPVRPTLTLVVNNKEKAPAATDAKLISKNERNEYDRNK